MNLRIATLYFGILLLSMLTSCATTPQMESTAGTESVPESAQPERSTETEAAGEAGASDEGSVTTEDTAQTEPATTRDGETGVPEFRLLRSRSVRRLANGVIDSYTEYRYLEDTGDLSIEEQFVPERELRRRKRYEYDPEGDVRVTTVGADGQVESIVLYTHDEAGRVIYEDHLDSRSEPTMSSVYTYDGPRLTRWELIDGAGELLSYSEYEYEDDSLVKVRNFDAAGKLSELVEYSYRDGRRVAERVVDAVDGTEVSREEYRYNDTGLLVEQVTRGPALYRTTRYAYNDDGLVVRETMLGRGEQELSSIEFEYMTVEIGGGPEEARGASR